MNIWVSCTNKHMNITIIFKNNKNEYETKRNSVGNYILTILIDSQI